MKFGNQHEKLLFVALHNVTVDSMLKKCGKPLLAMWPSVFSCGLFNYTGNNGVSCFNTVLRVHLYNMEKLGESSCQRGFLSPSPFICSAAMLLSTRYETMFEGKIMQICFPFIHHYWLKPFSISNIRWLSFAQVCWVGACQSLWHFNRILSMSDQIVVTKLLTRDNIYGKKNEIPFIPVREEERNIVFLAVYYVSAVLDDTGLCSIKVLLYRMKQM